MTFGLRLSMSCEHASAPSSWRTHTSLGQPNLDERTISELLTWNLKPEHA